MAKSFYAKPASPDQDRRRRAATFQAKAVRLYRAVVADAIARVPQVGGVERYCAAAKMRLAEAADEFADIMEAMDVEANR